MPDSLHLGYIDSVSSITSNDPSNNTIVNVAKISLPAYGTWIITGFYSITTNASNNISYFGGGFSKVVNTITDAIVYNSSTQIIGTTTHPTISIQNSWVYQVISDTTVHYNVIVAFSGTGTLTQGVLIFATRIA